MLKGDGNRNEADACREYVLPKLTRAGWEEPPHSFTEQRTFTDGRVMVSGSKARRCPRKRADYLLRYTSDFPIAVVEAKRERKTSGAGLQQAKDYAEILGLMFVYVTNGHGIVEFDYLTGVEKELDFFTAQVELWERLRMGQGIDEVAAERLLTPSLHLSSNTLLSRDRHQLCRRGRAQGATADLAYHGDGNGQDGRSVPNLLEALERQM